MDIIDCVYRLNPQIIIKQVDSESCLIDPYRRVMLRLNSVAAEILGFVDGTRSVKEIIALMRQSFDAREEEISRDVLNTLKEFAKKEIII